MDFANWWSCSVGVSAINVATLSSFKSSTFLPWFLQSQQPWQCPYFLAVSILHGSPLYYSWQDNTRPANYTDRGWDWAQSNTVTFSETRKDQRRWYIKVQKTTKGQVCVLGLDWQSLLSRVFGAWAVVKHQKMGGCHLQNYICCNALVIVTNFTKPRYTSTKYATLARHWHKSPQ